MNIVFRLTGEMIDGGKACCRGSQLARIVTAMSSWAGDLTWYVTDVDAIGDVRWPGNAKPARIGNSQEFLSRLQHVDQFLRGVFLGVDQGVVNPQFRGSIDTEDPIDVDLGSSSIEIRAFDTSYFELLTQDSIIAHGIAEMFGVHTATT